MNDVIPSPSGTNRLERRGHRWLFLRARLKPGASFEQARANVQVIANRLMEEYPATNKDRLMSVRRTSDVHFIRLRIRRSCRSHRGYGARRARSGDRLFECRQHAAGARLGAAA
jgi:hypothetical protein